MRKCVIQKQRDNNREKSQQYFLYCVYLPVDFFFIWNHFTDNNFEGFFTLIKKKQIYLLFR